MEQLAVPVLGGGAPGVLVPVLLDAVTGVRQDGCEQGRAGHGGGE
ncbi:hypothetical protein ACFCYB_42740 [Streptomyces sp. NPDC056309]